MSGISRRRFVKGAATAVAIGAFDTAAQAWVPATAHAHGRGRGHVSIPALDGELVVDTSRSEFAEAGSDFGAMITSAPWAVLIPGSHDDVIAMVRFCDRHGIKIAQRGQGHSSYGQAQAEGGLVVDSRTLDTVYSITSDHAWVDAGVVWRDFLAQTVALGVAPAVLPDYLGLSIGGVLSVGGIGGTAHQHGLCVNTCEELEVVTGDGRVMTCSATCNADLFRAVLGGLGQYALILKAKIKLVPQPPMARLYQLVYPDLALYLDQMRTLNDDERFEFIEGQVVSDGAGGWLFAIQALTWYTPGGTLPDDAALLSGLTPVSTTISDLPFLAFANRVDTYIAAWSSYDVHYFPWSDLFVPDDAIQEVVTDALARVTPEAIGLGVQLVYPFKRSRVGDDNLIQLPATETVWLFDTLRVPLGDDLAFAESLVDENRVLYEEVAAAGGKRYPISAVPFSQRDWLHHYGRDWFRVVASKARYDRNNTLTPGQGIFRR